jgi:ABC-2 type transport system ATP-binding protein
LSPAIEVRGIEKSFVKKRPLGQILTRPWRRAERHHALRGVSLDMREGEILGLLGPNGAGKTTLLKILSCLVLPDKGTARVGGFDVRQEQRVKPRIGLVHSDERSFYWRLSARENLRFFARLYNLEGRRIGSRIDELLRRVDMLEAADRPFSDYSSGMKQRIAIARALLHDPPILLMDEPTRSLDPAASLSLRQFVLEELSGRDGKTILLATHNLHEAESMADRVAVLVGGLVREVGTVAEVRHWGLDGQRYTLDIDDRARVLAGPFRVLDDTVVDGRRRVTVVLDHGTAFEVMLQALLGLNLGLRSCDRHEPDLESAFARILRSSQEPQA